MNSTTRRSVNLVWYHALTSWFGDRQLERQSLSRLAGNCTDTSHTSYHQEEGQWAVQGGTNIIIIVDMFTVYNNRYHPIMMG